jgi:hypothetical protein
MAIQATRPGLDRCRGRVGRREYILELLSQSSSREYIVEDEAVREASLLFLREDNEAGIKKQSS